jgi:hypothetical protein
LRPPPSRRAPRFANRALLGVAASLSCTGGLVREVKRRRGAVGVVVMIAACRCDSRIAMLDRWRFER